VSERVRVLIDTTYIQPANAETVGDAGIYFAGSRGVDDLTEQLGRLLDRQLVAAHRRRATQRAQRHSWDAVTDRYERLLTEVYERQQPGLLPTSLLDLDLETVPAA
jgi:glycosyltransferase involved in cell wall biosynthesis